MGRIKKYFGGWNVQNGPPTVLTDLYSFRTEWKLESTGRLGISHAKKWRNIPKNFRDFDPEIPIFCNWLLMPEIVLTDFETGILPAIKKSFTSLAISDVGFTIPSVFSENFRSSDPTLLGL